MNYQRELNPFAPPFYPSRFNRHHASITKRTRELLVKFLEDHCKTQNEMVGNDEKSAFDFVYLPIDFKHVYNIDIIIVDQGCGEKWGMKLTNEVANPRCLSYNICNLTLSGPRSVIANSTCSKEMIRCRSEVKEAVRMISSTYSSKFAFRIGLMITSLDLIGVIDDAEFFCKICDKDVVYVCLLLSLEVIFMGRKLVHKFDDTLTRLVENLEAWNAFPSGEHIWIHLYKQMLNIVSNHKAEHLKGLHMSRNYVPTYTLSGFLWSFKIWILESFQRSNCWWSKDSEVIPRGLAWSRKAIFESFDLSNLFCKDSKATVDLQRTFGEYLTEWWKFNNELLKNYIRRTQTRTLDLFYAYLLKVLVHKTNGVVVDKLEFSEDFLNLSIEFCDELNKEFLELFDSHSSSSGTCCSNLDIDEDVDEFRMKLKEEEMMLFKEDQILENESRLRLEEEAKMMREKENMIEEEKFF
nr:phospholipase-like protein [Tanacetum cinerariifolium]